MEMLEAFFKAEEYVRRAHPDEVEWSLAMVEKDPTMVTKREFASEYAWCVYTAGFRVEVVRNKWPELEKAYYGFDVERICEFAWKVKKNALKVIRNERKTETILKGIDILRTFTCLGWFKFMIKVRKNLDELTILPGVGPVLKYHLARNIGLDTIKPDVHLRRMAHHYGMNPFDMCEKIHEVTGLPVHLVDSIIWRASADKIFDFRKPSIKI